MVDDDENEDFIYEHPKRKDSSIFYLTDNSSTEGNSCYFSSTGYKNNANYCKNNTSKRMSNGVNPNNNNTILNLFTNSSPDQYANGSLKKSRRTPKNYSSIDSFKSHKSHKFSSVDDEEFFVNNNHSREFFFNNKDDMESMPLLHKNVKKEKG